MYILSNSYKVITRYKRPMTFIVRSQNNIVMRAALFGCHHESKDYTAKDLFP